MKRRVLRIGAIIGAAAVSTLAVAPAFAAAATSQATAQSIDVSLGGSTVVSQEITATNDGTSETRNDASTVPTLASLLTGNNALGAGVAPQDAHANTDGTSFACAGLAGTGGGIAYVGDSECDVDAGEPLTLNLGSLDLDFVTLLGEGAVTGPLNDALGPILGELGPALDDVLAQLTAGLEATPLGAISLDGALSTIEADCTADPDAAQGGAEIVDTSGDRSIPIRVTIPTAEGGTQTLNLVDLDVDLEPRPGGYDLLVNLDEITEALFLAIEGQVETALGGAIAGLNDLLEPLFTDVIQAQIVEAVVDQLREPLLQPLSDNILRVVVLDRTYGDAGRSVEVTALRAEVLPAAAEFTGAALLDGMIGHVTCGPNTRGTNPPAEGEPNPPTGDGDLPDVPTVVDSGVAGKSDHTARNVLGATAALMLLAGTAGLMGYRRMLDK